MSETIKQARWEVVPSDLDDEWGIRKEGDGRGKSIAQMMWKWDAEYMVDLHNRAVREQAKETPAMAERAVLYCPVCRGTGEVPEGACHACKGSGLIWSDEAPLTPTPKET